MGQHTIHQSDRRRGSRVGIWIGETFPREAGRGRRRRGRT
jgi:hypothetical protein